MARSGKRIGSLSVLLGLNSKPFTTGMQRASAATRRLVGGVARAGVQVAKFGAVGAGIAAGGLSVLVKRQMSAIDSATKFADRIGVSTEALTGLRYAASQSGVAASDLEMGLQRMTRRVAEAAAGGGPAADALKRLGLNAKELARLAPDEQFKSIADAMEGIDNQGERVRTAFAIFDSGGVGLLNTMRGGAEAIGEAQAEAEKLGLTFSRVDAAKVEMANDAMTRLQALVTGVGRTMAIQLAPYIEAAGNKLLELGLTGGSTADKIVTGFEWVATGIAKVSDLLSLGNAIFYGLQFAATKALEGITRGLALVPRGFHILQGTATTAIAAIVRGLGNVVEGVSHLASLLGLNVGETTFFREFASELDRAADAAFAKAEKRNMADMFADDLSQAADASFQKAADAMEDFMSSAAQKSVKATFDQIRSDAQQRAEDIAARARERADMGTADTGKDKTRPEAQLGPLSLTQAGSAEAQRMAFAAVADSLRVDVPDEQKQQLEEQRKATGVLERIERHTGALSDFQVVTV